MSTSTQNLLNRSDEPLWHTHRNSGCAISREHVQPTANPPHTEYPSMEVSCRPVVFTQIASFRVRPSDSGWQWPGRICVGCSYGTVCRLPVSGHPRCIGIPTTRVCAVAWLHLLFIRRGDVHAPRSCQSQSFNFVSDPADRISIDHFEDFPAILDYDEVVHEGRGSSEERLSSLIQCNPDLPYRDRWSVSTPHRGPGGMRLSTT